MNPALVPRRQPQVSPPAAQRGVALLLVLWLAVLLTVLASGLAFETRGEAHAARNSISQAQARLRADGAVSRALFELTRPLGPADKWQADGSVHRWRDGPVAVEVVVLDESGRIDLNSAPEPLLRGLLRVVGGVDEDKAASIVAAILDWRDADDLARPGGAEEAQYRAAGLRYRPSNQPFESVEELRRVLGVTEQIFARTSASLTVYSKAPGVNPRVASREVLLSLPGATAEMVDGYLALRAEALSAKQPPPAFPLGAAFNAAPVQVWRIRAGALTADGVPFVREAVARPSFDPRRVPSILLWREAP
jgi:general secretion pathway protein K